MTYILHSYSRANRQYKKHPRDSGLKNSTKFKVFSSNSKTLAQIVPAGKNIYVISNIVIKHVYMWPRYFRNPLIAGS